MAVNTGKSEILYAIVLSGILTISGCNLDDDNGAGNTGALDSETLADNSGGSFGNGEVTGAGGAGDRTLTISWNAPTVNDDGSALTDLAGYRIYYGIVPGQYDDVVEVSHTGMTSVVIGDLTPGTYYVVMSSINNEGAESAPSYEVSRTVL